MKTDDEWLDIIFDKSRVSAIRRAGNITAAQQMEAAGKIRLFPHHQAPEQLRHHQILNSALGDGSLVPTSHSAVIDRHLLKPF